MAYVDLKNLVAHWKELSHETECEDITMCLEQDANDAQNVLDFLEHSNMEGAMSAINRMDTAPREQLVLAFAEDCGKDFVKSYLGYEVR